MKKVLSFFLCAVMVFGLVACGNKDGNEPDSGATGGDKMSLTEIADKLTEGISEDEAAALMAPTTLDEVVDMQPEMDCVSKEQVYAETFESYLFIPAIEGAEVVIQDNAMGGAHSMVLLRLPDGSDVETVRGEIEANANPRKWICVEAEKVNVAAHGNTILLVMSTESMVDTISSNFDALWA